MSPASRSPQLSSPVELKERIDAERAGSPFVVHRDETGVQRIVRLSEQGRSLTVGRSADSDICLDWDERVSQLHAELSPVGDHWLVVDDGLSRNGTYVNGERVAGRRRLRDRDELTVGGTMLLFRNPGRRASRTTVVGAWEDSAPDLSPAQRRVLVGLCRPFKDSGGFATPATNQQIAEELVLSVHAVKTHMRTLFQKFGVNDLPQNQKRARLVELAFESGAVSERDL